MNRLLTLLVRETALAWGRGGGPLVAVGFYAGVATFLPLAIGPEPARLAAIAPGAAWVALALASLLSPERLFERDYEDGALDQLLLSTTPLELTCFIKCLGQWLANGAPLALAAPVAAIALGASPASAPLTLASALLGGLAFAFMGGVGAALSLGARRGGVLTAVIVLPLFVPPVIFGGGALDAFAAGLPWSGGFAARRLRPRGRGRGPAGDGRGLPQRGFLNHDQSLTGVGGASPHPGLRRESLQETPT